MDIRKINDSISVSPQIGLADIATLKELGFGGVICNRPDGEEPGQPEFAQIADAARAAGLSCVWVPITGGAASAQAVEDFAAALADMSAPVLAYCRSGTRSTILWALSQAGKAPAEEILAQARAAGYDMAPLAPQLAARG